MAKSNQSTQPSYESYVEDAFDGMDDQKPPVSETKKVLPGDYIVETTGNKLIKSAQTGTRLFIAEMEIKQSNNKELPVGETMAWIMPTEGKSKETKLGAIRGYVAASLGLPVEDIKAAHMPEVVGPKQRLVGSVVKLKARRITLKNGQPFTQCQWSTFRGEMPNPANDNAFDDVAEEEVPF